MYVTLFVQLGKSLGCTCQLCKSVINKELYHCSKLPDGKDDISRGLIPGKIMKPYLLYLQGTFHTHDDLTGRYVASILCKFLTQTNTCLYMQMC